MGAALVPEAARDLRLKGVVPRELAPAPTAAAALYLVQRRDRDNPAFRTFRDPMLPELAAG